ncbi:MAG: hypothetical protein JXQ27_10395 [Acidobacteria bacterium]|nr:hypothetical protein [Acidobacteriota bacterium]
MEPVSSRDDGLWLRRYLPEIYRPFLPDLFDTRLPAETLATCADCIMLTPEGQAPDAEDGTVYFSPVTRCCTYVPIIPNYLVGALLLDRRPENAPGRAVVRILIDQRRGIFPQGLFPSPRLAQLYERNAPRCFGRSEALACPLLDTATGHCTVWPFRNAICATWFCKYAAGIEGRRFWDALKRYLCHVEQSLSSWALLTLGWPATDILSRLVEVNPYSMATYSLSPAELDDRPPAEAEVQHAWRDWYGREAEFYRKCAGCVADVTPAEYRAITGVYQEIYLRQMVEAAQAVLDPSLPAYLHFRPAGERAGATDDLVRLNGFNGWLEIPMALYRCLQQFDGRRSTEQVLAAIRLTHQMEVDTEVLIRLHQRRILVAVEPPDRMNTTL